MNFSLWKPCPDFLFLLFIPFVRRMNDCLFAYLLLPESRERIPRSKPRGWRAKKIPHGSENPCILTLCSSITDF